MSVNKKTQNKTVNNTNQTNNLLIGDATAPGVRLA